MTQDERNIEIRREWSPILGWMATGVLVVVVVFFLFLEPYDLWPAVNASGIASAVFLIVLIIAVTRPPVQRYTRWIVLATALVVLFMHWYSWIEQQEQSKWQRSQLMRIHSYISGAIATTAMGDSLLLCLRDYCAQSDVPRQSMGEVFLARFPFAREGGSFYTPLHPDDSLQVHVLVLKPDSIQLAGRISYARGRNPNFIAYDGRVGVMEHRVTLTAGGLRHEFTN